MAPVLVLIGLLAGCSHYGYVDRDVPQTAASVWTVAAPADEALDQARLTRSLVGAMRQEGIDATWQTDSTSMSATRSSVRCSVSHTEVDGFGTSLFARAQVICHTVNPVDPARQAQPTEQFEASGRYTATISGGMSAIAPTRSEVQEAAAVEALERVADQIAQFMLQSSR